RALRVFGRELAGIEKPALRTVVPVRHGHEQPLYRLRIGELAAREHRERAERERLLEEQAPLQELELFHGALPVTIVGMVRGTSSAITTCTTTRNTSSAMAKKCSRRAPSYPPMRAASSWSCTGFQIARPESTSTTSVRMMAR